jgi:probable rRNA maturation factor
LSGVITVRNRQRRFRVDIKALQEFSEQALPLCLAARRSRSSQLVRLPEISVLLISDRRISALHQQFLKVSGPTDVITFDHGEIFISVDTARRQARDFGTSVMNELQLYVVHGLLHLHGFDDQRKSGARVMEKKQKQILKRIEEVKSQPSRRTLFRGRRAVREV